jgi:hypothetical protein
MKRFCRRYSQLRLVGGQCREREIDLPGGVPVVGTFAVTLEQLD